MSGKEDVFTEALPATEDSSSSDEANDKQITDGDVSEQNSFWEIEDEDAPTGIKIDVFLPKNRIKISILSCDH